MKKILLNKIGLRSVGAVLFVYLMANLSFGQANVDFRSKTDGTWATLGTWEYFNTTTMLWTAATAAPVSTNNVTITHIVTQEASNKQCKNLTIDGGTLKASGASSGSPHSLRIFGSSVVELKNSGTLGGTSTAADGYISLEPATTGATVELKGSGTVAISRIRPGNGATGTTTKININTNLVTTGQALSSNSLTNTTIEISANKTVTTTGYVAASNNSTGDPGTGANFTFNVYGSLTTTTTGVGGNLNLANKTGFSTNVTLFKDANVSLAGNVMGVVGSTADAMSLKIEEGAALSITGSSSDVTGCTVEYKTATTGSTGASISAPTKLVAVKNLTINNTGGVVLGAATTVSGALTLTTGNLTLGANNLTIGTVTGGSQASHVLTDGAGVLQSAIGASATKIFPIGATNISYDPVSITPTNAVTFGASVKNTFTNAVVDANKTTSREWNINATGAGSTVLAFTADATLTPPLGTNVIGHYISGAWNITDMTSVSRTGNTYTGTNAAGSFSPFGGGIVGGFDAVASVELTNFKAKANNQSNFLTWATATEKNNSHFNIERSANGSNFMSIGTVKGNGTITTANNYTFTDETPLSISYYRLQSVDFDGTTQASNIVSVFRSTSGKLKVYPTVASDKLNIVMDNNDAQTFSISDVMGRTVQTGQLNGQKELSISTLATGTYVLKVGGDVVKFVKH